MAHHFRADVDPGLVVGVTAALAPLAVLMFYIWFRIFVPPDLDPYYRRTLREEKGLTLREWRAERREAYLDKGPLARAFHHLVRIPLYLWRTWQWTVMGSVAVFVVGFIIASVFESEELIQALVPLGSFIDDITPDF